MRTLRIKLFLLLLISVSPLIAVNIDLDLACENLVLKNQKRYEKVLIKSYNSESNSVTLFHNKSIVTVGFDLLPAEVQQEVRKLLPAEDVIEARSKREEARRAEREAKRETELQKFKQSENAKVRASIARAADEDARKKSQERRFLADSLALARTKAEQYYRYEHTIGGNNVIILRDSLILNQPRQYTSTVFPGPMMEVTGQVGLQYYDSSSYKFKRFVAEFEVNTRTNEKGNPIIESFRHTKEVSR
jgi:hypothetical protein